MKQDASQTPSSPVNIVADALQSLKMETVHSQASMVETRHWLNNPGLTDPSLVDLTHLPFVTIDNPDSRDLDQALLIERHDDRTYRVRYALADAAYYVPPGSALFASALARGATYYTPILSVPMLPTELSEGLVSLNPQVDRRALVFDMIVDDQAVVSRTCVERARIHSQAKLDYAGVQAWLDSDPQPQRPYDESLLLLRELGNLLIQAAGRRGVVRFDRTETRISVEGQPPRFTASRRKRYATERYNEQLSLMCNMQGAEMMLALSGVSDAVQAVFRVHEAPLRKSLGELRDTLAQFAERQPEPALWRWQKGQSLADYVDKLPQAARYRGQVLSIQRQIMQAQRASSFTPDAGEHHALKAASYARFSSPMREVVGIFTHKELLEALGGHSYDKDVDTDLRDAVIESANHSRQVQRKLEKTIEFATLFSVFSNELTLAEPPEHAGTIMGLRGDRLYVSLEDLAMDVKVYREDIEQQFGTDYEMGDIAATPSNRQCPEWVLGDAVQLRVRSYDEGRKRFRFTLAGHD
ncbi:RNB domain-containing ribonuclease [Granulosicoccus sp. 3-233]|uniref:RNB domain-containing ribonuclease n=1 Tax=Granulosicoccus sp. 3-233 TaxID=3417969 RepID=UPI003D33042C